jgi:hypothetical protein
VQKKEKKRRRNAPLPESKPELRLLSLKAAAHAVLS